MLSMVMLPAKPSSLNRSAIRSDSGNTVELPAVMMLPLTFSGSTPGRMGSSDSLTVQLTFVWLNSGTEAPAAARTRTAARISFLLIRLPPCQLGIGSKVGGSACGKR